MFRAKSLENNFHIERHCSSDICTMCLLRSQTAQWGEKSLKTYYLSPKYQIIKEIMEISLPTKKA